MEASARQDTLPTIWRIPDDLWLIVQYVLPREELQRSRGRPWIAPRCILDGVLYVLRTGCQWKAVPREYGSGSTVHRRFPRWGGGGGRGGVWGPLVPYYDAGQRPGGVWEMAGAPLPQTPPGGGKKRGHTHPPRG